MLYQLSYVGGSVLDRTGPQRAGPLAPPRPAPVRGAGRTPRERPYSSTRHHGTTTRSTAPTAANIAIPIAASTTTTANTSAVAVWLP